MKTVYLLGAGVNQVVRDWDGHCPPLLSNFFSIALHKKKFSDDHYTQQIQEVYDYIKQTLHITKEDLENNPFDLELCFTLMDRQFKQAIKEKRTEEFRKLFRIRFQLESFLAEVLSDFEHFAVTSHTMRNFGRVILYEEPTIITFNYDCLMESVLESAFGVRLSLPKSFRDFKPFEEKELPDELLVYSHYNWNKPLGYGFKFDEVQLQQAGVSQFVRGSRFYSLSENQLYAKPLLKMHGSLNWFRYLPIRTIPSFPDEPKQELGEKASEILLKDGTWWFGRSPDHNGWLLAPLIITPVLYKDEYYDEKPFKEIWSMSKDALSECNKLVIIGYSFSPTDFSTKQLLIESLKDNDLDELVVVNPDVNVVRTAKELCHFNKGAIWHSNLNDYLQTFSGCVRLESEMPKMKEENLPKDTTPHDLYVKCKTCGIEFGAGIRTNPRSHATSQYIGNVHTCPKGHTNSYDKQDYILKKIE